MKLISDPAVAKVLNKYPKKVQEKLNVIRELILKTASEMEDIDQLEETLKWGEPSYISIIGSTLRMDWKEKNPNQIALYFKCTSKLVPTFKMIFGDTFTYENNRAILLKLENKIPEKDLQICISMALRYHKVKSAPLLGYK